MTGIMLISDDYDFLRGDRDVFNRDRQTEYYNTKVCDLVTFYKLQVMMSIFTAAV